MSTTETLPKNGESPKGVVDLQFSPPKPKLTAAAQKRERQRRKMAKTTLVQEQGFSRTSDVPATHAQPVAEESSAGGLESKIREDNTGSSKPVSTRSHGKKAISRSRQVDRIRLLQEAKRNQDEEGRLQLVRQREEQDAKKAMEEQARAEQEAAKAERAAKKEKKRSLQRQKGTYLTPAQKAKISVTLARMKASGMMPDILKDQSFVAKSTGKASRSVTAPQHRSEEGKSKFQEKAEQCEIRLARDMSTTSSIATPLLSRDGSVSSSLIPEHLGGSTTRSNSREETKSATTDSTASSSEMESVADPKYALRSPICCVLGHVDTGKTKLLDKIRQSHVQDREAGGITQQIGITFLPTSVIQSQTSSITQEMKKPFRFQIPGLLVLDTPGHDTFLHLRSRGTNLCDIAILVIDIMHGVQHQTMESIRLLKEHKTPFIVALNKVDRLYRWKPVVDSGFQGSLATQTVESQDEFQRRLQQIIAALATESLNACLYYDNKDMSSWVSIVPTSAITGEGIPDLLLLVVALTQSRLSKQLVHREKDWHAFVVEVTIQEGLGCTLDVLLIHGQLSEGDTIVVAGLDGPIVTKIRSILTPPACTESRVKTCKFLQHKTVQASMAIKIVAPHLEGCVAGSTLQVFRAEDDLEDTKTKVQSEIKTILSKVDRSGKGVWVQSSSVGSLEALVTFLTEEKIPVKGMAVGPLQKKHILASSTMLESSPEFAVVLAFDVSVSAEVMEFALKEGVKVYTADIIYHLFDRIKKHLAFFHQGRKEVALASGKAIFPCILKMIDKESCFRQKDPLLLGVQVIEGVVRLGTPLVAGDPLVDLGQVVGLQIQNEDVKEATEGQKVCVKIQMNQSKPVQYKRHFTYTDIIYSKVSRESIDTLKASFQEEMTDSWWKVSLTIPLAY